MADLIPLRTTQQMPASTFAGLFGLFAGLCALFAACVTISDWFDEATQARWPLVSAVVDRADVVVLSRSPKDGGGTATSLRYRARYQVNGIERTAILTSRNAFSDTDAATLQFWAAQHRKGSHIDVRYDSGRGSEINRSISASTFARDRVYRARVRDTTASALPKSNRGYVVLRRKGSVGLPSWIRRAQA